MPNNITRHHWPIFKLELSKKKREELGLTVTTVCLNKHITHIYGALDDKNKISCTQAIPEFAQTNNILWRITKMGYTGIILLFFTFLLGNPTSTWVGIATEWLQLDIPYRSIIFALYLIPQTCQFILVDGEDKLLYFLGLDMSECQEIWIT